MYEFFNKSNQFQLFAYVESFSLFRVVPINMDIAPQFGDDTNFFASSMLRFSRDNSIEIF